ncbi:MAG TPA: AMP-binding protein [Verrucomicrobiae bacterium]
MTALEQHWPDTYRHARKYSPFYRARWQGRRGVPSLSTLPLTDKKMISRRPADFLCVPPHRIAEIVTTSGTTGQPLLWPMTSSDINRLAENEKISFTCAGLTPRDRVLVAVAMDRCFIAGLAYWQGLQALGCTVIRAGASSAQLVLELLTRTRPTAIIGVPSFLRLIAERARAADQGLKRSSVKKLICIGEPIRQADFTLNPTGAWLRQAWGAEVFSTYGVTELANSLCECPAGRGGHLHEHQLHLEILDAAGQPLPAGEVGEVVATTFGVEAMPLIRYRTGDCAALHTSPCACGRATPRLGPIVGRKNQLLKFKGTSLFPSTIQTALEAAGVEKFVVIARRENELSDAVEIRYHGQSSPAALREAVQARARITPLIRRASRAAIDQLQLPPDQRKRRTFVDLR